jgi:hypothetical protein
VAATIRRLYNGEWQDFDRSMLETAWLVRADVDRTVGPVGVGSQAVVRLQTEFGWPLGAAIVYVVAASNWDGKD